MKPLTVNELHISLTKLIAMGRGDNSVYVTTDEECNDYRPIWFAPITDRLEIESVMALSCSGLNNSIDTSKAILLV